MKLELEGAQTQIQAIENNLRHISSHLKEIDKSLQAVEVRLETYNGTLKVNTASLETHIKRTEILEISQKDDRARYFQLMISLVIALFGVIITIALKH